MLLFSSWSSMSIRPGRSCGPRGSTRYPGRGGVQSRLGSATCSIGDAKQKSASPETRTDAAHRAITELCRVALWVNGFRLFRGRPGHHRTMIQSLVFSVGSETDAFLFLDAFRLKRNTIDQAGDDVDATSVGECVAAAENLRQHVSEWISRSKPELSAQVHAQRTANYFLARMKEQSTFQWQCHAPSTISQKSGGPR